MTIFFIRHGATAGNLEKRYIGSTDEPLSPVGAAEIAARCAAGAYPDADVLYVSPMRRCVETAALIYPDKTPISVPAMRECDFGQYERKNYAELTEDAPYLDWVASGGTLPFPGGEDTAAFKARCAAAFEEIISCHTADVRLAFAVHGGTIMSILEKWEARHSYFDWQCRNGGGYRAQWDGVSLTVTEEI